MLDKLSEIESKYITNNEWAWSPYIDLVQKEHLIWLIQQVKHLRDTRITQGIMILKLNVELKQANDKVTELTTDIRNFKAKTRFQVYEENLRLALENQQLKEQLFGKKMAFKDWTEF